MKRLVWALAMVLAASSARAATLEGVTLPDQMTVGGKTLVLNGIALRTLTIFEVKIYVAGLYVTQPSHDANQILASAEPKVLVLHYLHSGSKEAVQEEYRKGEQVNCGAGGCPAADAPDFERLVAVAPGVKPGDSTTYFITASGLRVLSNNQPLIELNNRDLGYRILLGFIGPHPPSPEVRSHLLGQ